MEAKPKVFIVYAHAATKQNLKGAAHWARPFYLKVFLALALLLGVAGALSYQRFDAKTAIRATVKVNAVVYENGQGVLVKSIGTLLSADGIIITNFHNVGDAQHIWVQTSVGQTADATVVAADPGTDLALLKIEGRNLPFVQLGNPGSLNSGETVHTASSSGSLDFSCVTGTVVGLDRQIGATPQTQLIQTEMPLSPDCGGGGPLFDRRGKLVGVNSAAWAASGGCSKGCSLAVPVVLVRDLLERYMSPEKSGNEVTTKTEAVLNSK